MKKIVFYGDSNTYGFDPRSFFGDRYDPARIWTSIVAEALSGSREVVNEGMNGRCVPEHAERSSYLSYLLSGLGEEDVFAVMLGTNDLLMRAEPDAKIPVARMEEFITWLLNKPGHPEVLLIAPPLAGGEKTADPYYADCRKEGIKMTEGYRGLAEKYRIRFADASAWEVELAYDLVHFSEEGHRIFAEKMLAYVQNALIRGKE